jgi:hypothetical protein
MVILFKWVPEPMKHAEQPIRSPIIAFADYVALAFHEARNVRHLVKDGKIERAKYHLLIDGLSGSRIEAWKQIQPLRNEATQAQCACDVEAIFIRKYSLTLEDLTDLSMHSGWRDSPYGGNKWVDIDRALIELRTAIEQGNEPSISRLLRELPQMPHNTGCLCEKLRCLDASLSGEP